MKIPGFQQDIKSFSKSKMNWIGIGVIIFTGASFYLGKIDFNQSMMGFGFGATLFAAKDAIAKAEK